MKAKLARLRFLEAADSSCPVKRCKTPENQFVKPGITLFISYLLGKFHRLKTDGGKAVGRAADRRITAQWSYSDSNESMGLKMRQLVSTCS